MKEIIIKQYIDKITIDDIYNFGVKNNIILNNKDLNLIYNCIKKNWKIIIFGDINPIFNNIKPNLDEETFNKIKNLYFKYKEKYKNYL